MATSDVAEVTGTAAVVKASDVWAATAGAGAYKSTLLW